MTSSGASRKKRLKNKAALKSPTGVKLNSPKISKDQSGLRFENSKTTSLFNYLFFYLYNLKFLSLFGSTFKHITVIRGRLPAETKIEEKIIRKFMKLARSNEAKNYSKKTPAKFLLTDIYW